MADNNVTGVSAAFEMLLEEIEAEVELINELGARAFQESDYVAVDQAKARGKSIAEFRDRLASLSDDWTEVINGLPAKKKQTKRRKRREMGRIEPGMKTPESVFIIPILKTLDDLGGPAKAIDVLDRLEPLVTNKLKEIDYESLASGPGRPRWRSTASAARWKLVQDGLVRDDSPYGTWEISDKGKHFLAEYDRS